MSATQQTAHKVWMATSARIRSWEDLPSVVKKAWCAHYRVGLFIGLGGLCEGMLTSAAAFSSAMAMLIVQWPLCIGCKKCCASHH